MNSAIDKLPSDENLHRNFEQFELKHPNQHAIQQPAKTPQDILIEIEERDRRTIQLLAALPRPISYELLQTLAGNRDDYSLQGIANRCGISRATLYRQIQNAKESIK